MLSRSYKFYNLNSCYGLTLGKQGIRKVLNPSTLSLPRNRICDSMHRLRLHQYFPTIVEELKSSGLGFKIFISGQVCYLDFGYSHFCLFKLPNNLRVRCGKKKAFFFRQSVEGSVFHSLNRVKRMSVYKSKGFIFSNRVRYLKLRMGKKQQV